MVVIVVISVEDMKEAARPIDLVRFRNNYTACVSIRMRSLLFYHFALEQRNAITIILSLHFPFVSQVTPLWSFREPLPERQRDNEDRPLSIRGAYLVGSQSWRI